MPSYLLLKVKGLYNGFVYLNRLQMLIPCKKNVEKMKNEKLEKNI